MTRHNRQTDINDPGELLIEISADIAEIADNICLYNPQNFDSRTDAIDFIDFHVIDRIDSTLPVSNSTKRLLVLKESAEKLKLKLEKINESLFTELRADIKTGNCRGKAFKEMVAEYFGTIPENDRKPAEVGYDNLDAFINGLLLTKPLPKETLDRAPEMVFYQQTPARIILELVEKADFKPHDVFYDIGSGLGHVPILVNLLIGIKAKGIEFEPAYCDYATALEVELKLTDVNFINEDAREADYSDGTAFFMYTPFKGKMLNEMLERLRVVSEERLIKLFTYGPCMLEVARQGWLTCQQANELHEYKLEVFESIA